MFREEPTFKSRALSVDQRIRDSEKWPRIKQMELEIIINRNNYELKREQKRKKEKEKERREKEIANNILRAKRNNMLLIARAKDETNFSEEEINKMKEKMNKKKLKSTASLTQSSSININNNNSALLTGSNVSNK